MVRDRIKNQEYFEKYIGELYDDINFYKEKLSKNEVKPERLASVKWNLRQSYLHLLIAKYSAGYELNEIKNDFIELQPLLVETWEIDDSIITLYWVYSLFILLEVKEDIIKSFDDIIISYNIKDALLNFFRNYINTQRFSMDDFFIPKNPYPLLKEIIRSDNKKELIISYIRKEWYKGPANSCQYWHDSHKSMNNTYFGYWSFEAGAIAKILGIDDSDLKDEPYYPYDLVHYCD